MVLNEGLGLRQAQSNTLTFTHRPHFGQSRRLDRLNSHVHPLTSHETLYYNAKLSSQAPLTLFPHFFPHPDPVFAGRFD